MSNKKQLFVRKILEKAHSYEWSFQGFGMLRLYLSDNLRLHVWDNTHAVPNVSLVHNHPWDFNSEVICGKITNVRYSESPRGSPFKYATILCGPKGGKCSEEKEIFLLQEKNPSSYTRKSEYYQSADEIHKSIPENGTVTLVERMFKPDTDHALVFWEKGNEWVSAEPHRATVAEIDSAVPKVMEVLNKELHE